MPSFMDLSLSPRPLPVSAWTISLHGNEANATIVVSNRNLSAAALLLDANDTLTNSSVINSQHQDNNSTIAEKAYQ
jgi:hypothetical protein